MDAWLSGTVTAITEGTSVDPSALMLTDEDVKALLGIARIASHDSGDRTNAPLLCYLAGRLLERAPSATLEAIHGVVAGRAREDA